MTPGGPISELESQRRKVCELSNFCANWCDANGERLQTLSDKGVLNTTADRDQIRAGIAAYCDAHEETDALMAPLRQARNERMFVIAWRDLLGLADLDETLAALSDLADSCIETALLAAERAVAQRYGQIKDSTGEVQRLITIGMGKLGGRELNFSSDIDLIFAYRDNGESDGVKTLEAQEYYKRQIQQVARLLNEATEDGFVYRVDTRLRPFGDAGAMAASLNAMEGYYQNHGREWERYAWIKARPVAGDIEGGQRLIKLLRPFVYRRYLDFSAFESIREMKSMIDKQVEQRGVEHNIKIGRGGIREVEFIAQAFQLIRGGHEPELQDNRLRPVLDKLKQEDHLPAHAVRDLQQAYIFLRRLENRLQMWDDRQTHTLPENDEAWRVLARAMGSDNSDSLRSEIADHRERVHQQFQQVFAVPQVNDEADERSTALRTAWLDEEPSEAGAKLIQDEGFADPVAAWQALLDLRNSGQYRSLADRGRRRLGELIPLLIQAVATSEDPDTTLLRVLKVLESIIGRTTYVALLVENPTALSRFVSLCAASPWISRQIEQQPVLLDSLLDPRLLYQPPRGEALQQELDRILSPIAQDDLERRMDTLRRFRHEQMLRIAAADVSNSIPLMVVSDHLTELAEIILRQALDEAWNSLSAKYGQPTCADGSVASFIIVGYGKMGGIELGYSSDLDVVFLHNGKADANTDGQNEGKRSLSHHAFFLRLAQRIIHILATQTSHGRVYEIDTRLRPSGKSGLLVTSLKGFQAYQNEKAWTWEHQALVRARAVAGDAELIEAFAQTRSAMLSQSRDADKLGEEVVKMRAKMREHLDQSDAGKRDVKQMPGGLIDIEFIAQYCCLRYAASCPELLIYTDTIRILETLESAQLLDLETTRALTSAYRAFRERVHRDALQEKRATIAVDDLEGHRAAVERVWGDTLGDTAY